MIDEMADFVLRNTDWHQSFYPDDPPCGPDEWRMRRDRGHVMKLSNMSAVMLEIINEMALNLTRHRSRLAAVQAELQRRGITPKGTP